MKICALFLIALAAQAQHVNVYSIAQEAELGRIMTATALKTLTPTVHEDVRDYVQQLGDRLASQMVFTPDRRGHVYAPEFRFAVVREDSRSQHEPMMLPGGYILVPEPLILAAHDEAEFAGMLAHAMAHASERHVTRLLTMSYVIDGRIVIPNSDVIPDFKRLSEGLPIYRSQFERSADAIATPMVAAAGFDPAAFARYLERQGDSRRAARIDAAAAKLPAREYTTGGEFLAIQNELRL